MISEIAGTVNFSMTLIFTSIPLTGGWNKIGSVNELAPTGKGTIGDDTNEELLVTGIFPIYYSLFNL